MSVSITVPSPEDFSNNLFEKMQGINPAIADMELYEFRYCLDNITPPSGWASIEVLPKNEIEQMVGSRAFYDSIQVKPMVDDSIVLDEKIVGLTRTLFCGLVIGDYPVEWVDRHFYFDVRGFLFMHRTTYFNEKIQTHFGGQPYRQFEQKQKAFEHDQVVGYKAFAAANADVDALFIASVKRIIAARGTPILLALAGATAAGKTEIVERLNQAFKQDGQMTASIEMDNFFTDRDYREARGIDSLGKKAMHLDLLKQSLEEITHGKAICTPRYNFIDGSSSHDLNGIIKPGRLPVQIDRGDIIFMEGNFPFLIEEILHLIGIKVVYLTDDPVRLKRKWKRDMDYRKKYNENYFRNRYFKDQFIMAECVYRPQMEVCDMVVDTTGAALWVTPEVAMILDKQEVNR
jgi:uridine kinase